MKTILDIYFRFFPSTTDKAIDALLSIVVKLEQARDAQLLEHDTQQDTAALAHEKAEQAAAEALRADRIRTKLAALLEA